MEHSEKTPCFGKSYYDLLQGIVSDNRLALRPGSVLLDFGCGDGQTVYHLRSLGLRAYGVDVVNRFELMQHRCQDEGLAQADEVIFGTLDMANYCIPFADDTFDAVVSYQVFEHVQNWEQALPEIYRVLKPGGFGLHIFPSRYRPLEPHVFVPFAGVMRSYPYLALWALLGVRNAFQRGMSWKQVASTNREYLTKDTNYLPKHEIRRLVTEQFGAVQFAEGSFMRYGQGRLRLLYPLARILPFIPQVVSTLLMRVVVFAKPAGLAANSDAV